MIPIQTRTIDPYADHRFTNTINRFSQIVTRGKNCILPDDTNNFDIDLPLDDLNTTVTISPGIFVKNDCIIQMKESVVLDFTNPDNYLKYTTNEGIFGYELSTTNPTDVDKYLILINYNHESSIPPKEASYVIAKNRSIYLTNTDYFIYLGTAHVRRYNPGTVDVDGYYNLGNPYIEKVWYFDYDETNNNTVFQRPTYNFFVNNLDGGTVTV